MMARILHKYRRIGLFRCDIETCVKTFLNWFFIFKKIIIKIILAILTFIIVPQKKKKNNEYITV